MRAIITITNYPSMPGRYRRTISHNGNVNKSDVVGGGAEGAAASAMEAATRFGSDGYQIFAPREVMEIIPGDMRGATGGRQ
jgi:NAD(P)H-hydrate repair Nnr-like enzyme with NAD(P)H-hydrate dehydratase domain